MEKVVTYEVFTWTVGLLTTVFSSFLLYWIKEIKGVEKSIDRHKADDEKEFHQSQMTNATEHSELRQMISSKTDSLSKDISNINVKLDFIIEEIKRGGKLH